MHPDATIAALRRELEQYPDRAKDIEAEIARVDALPRPAAEAETPDVVFDHDREYLMALERELERAPDRASEIKKEIERVQEALADEKPTAEEVEARKQARTGRKVQRATAAPGEVRETSESAKAEEE